MDADDPRWREIFDFLRWADRHQGRGAFGEFVGRFVKYTDAIESLADDATLSSQERAFAQEILEQIRLICWVLLPATIRAMAKLVNDPQLSPEERANIAQRLKDITMQLPSPSGALQ